MTFEEACILIESWDGKKIKKVLNYLSNDINLEEQLMSRYEDIINHIEGKNLSILSRIKTKIVVQKN